MREEIGRRIGLRIKLESDGNAGKKAAGSDKEFCKSCTCWNPKFAIALKFSSM